MLSSIHAFSVELRLASESVLGKVKYVTVKQSRPFPFLCVCRLCNASLLCRRYLDRHISPLFTERGALRDNAIDGCIGDQGVTQAC